MLKLVFACALVASAFADVSHLPQFQRGSARSEQQASILRESSEVQPDGGYQFGYETENGINFQEQGQVRALGPDQVDKTVDGSFSYTSPEGQPISLQYRADANGFQPQGAHLPVAPPIPAAIQRSIDYNLAHPEPVEPQRRF